MVVNHHHRGIIFIPTRRIFTRWWYFVSCERRFELNKTIRIPVVVRDNITHLWRLLIICFDVFLAYLPPPFFTFQNITAPFRPFIQNNRLICSNSRCWKTHSIRHSRVVFGKLFRLMSAPMRLKKKGSKGFWSLKVCTAISWIGFGTRSTYAKTIRILFGADPGI